MSTFQAKIFTQALQYVNVHHLKINCTSFIEQKADIGLCLGLRETTVDTLTLTAPEFFGSNNVSFFLQTLNITGIHTLHLPENLLDDKHMGQLAKDFANNTSIRFLDLSKNQIKEAGAKDFAANLQNPNIHKVYFSSNYTPEATRIEITATYPRIEWIFSEVDITT